MREEMLKSKGRPNERDAAKKKGDSGYLQPILNAVSNFKLAKKLHKENLEHEPLPDMVTDAMYKRLQMRRDREPGMALDEASRCTGIAWKGYPGYGPTRCTKLKVYRPKTGAQRESRRADGLDERPGSVGSFDRKWRFIRQRKVSPMDLAICWDLTPENPKDEPKRPIHVDGSNGSQAPAVFTLVHGGAKGKEVRARCDGVHGCAPIFGHAPGHDPENVGLSLVNRPKTAWHDGSAPDKDDQRAMSAFTEPQEKATQFSEQGSAEPHEKATQYSEQGYVAAEKCKHARPCVACDMKNLTVEEPRPCHQYKPAFKAGLPQKRNGRRRDYPEHWRLATVYQHSYNRPPALRKRSLLATVFK